MPHFMVRWQFNGASAKAMVENPHDRTAAAKALVEGFGGKLHCYYFSFGEYDGLAIGEMPDNTAGAACSMAAMATGAFTRFEFDYIVDSLGSRSGDEEGAQHQDRI